MRSNEHLIKKYNVAGPRYTSYPTVPFWKNPDLSASEWLDSIEKNNKFQKSRELSIYVHLPFCESLCTFCGCHKRITKNHSVESPYIDALIKEWDLYIKSFSFKPEIKEFHFGGGTPTFFDPDMLIKLLENIFSSNKVNPDLVDLGFEAHPNNTSEEHLIKLFHFGFRRLSLGIQDYSPVVQKTINRVQSFETVERIHQLAKNIGYSSISHDLVFGLPKQTLSDIEDTVNKTLTLRPDRISLYSYAHVPWIKGNGQRGYDESDLPQDQEKRALYVLAKELLEDAGYVEIGMDHFALPHDELYKAFKKKNLHRNFMGYTTQSTNLLIGLGMSAISDSWYGFAQNDKTVEGYQAKINSGELAIFRGHVLSDIDLELRQMILDLMCHFETSMNVEHLGIDRTNRIISNLSELIKDGLVRVIDSKIVLTDAGIPFVRNVCMALDEYLIGIEPNPEKLFSKTI